MTLDNFDRSACGPVEAVWPRGPRLPAGRLRAPVEPERVIGGVGQGPYRRIVDVELWRGVSQERVMFRLSCGDLVNTIAQVRGEPFATCNLCGWRDWDSARERRRGT